jgi:hypothetical protein
MRGKLFMIATEKIAVAEKAMARKNIFFVITLFMNSVCLESGYCPTGGR